jgi:rRNA maturation endonuclease Nob1
MVLTLPFLVAIGLAVLVIYPMLSTADEASATLPVDVTPAADLRRRRMVVYENLRDLDFEYQARKIAPKDYETLREAYKAEAARLMVASQDLDHGVAEDRFIEREISARRAKLKHRLETAYVCSKCGFQNPVPVKFCGECGSPLSQRQ